MVAEEKSVVVSGRELLLRQRFYPLGFGVEIVTNDAEVLAEAAACWGTVPMRTDTPIEVRIEVSEGSSEVCPPAPSVRLERHLISFVADVENQGVCDLNGNFAFAWLTCATVRNRMYFRYYFLEALVLVLVSSSFAPAVHAACVSRYGRGMLLCGDSGAGKSTLAYACARAGFTYTTDDASCLVLDADHARVIGQPEKVRFRPPARELFPELRDRDLTPRIAGKPSIEVPTSELSIVTAAEARIHYLILLRRSPETQARMVPIPTGVAIESLHANLYPVEEIRVRHMAALELLSSTRAYEFYYSDLEEAIGCLDLLAREPELGA